MEEDIRNEEELIDEEDTYADEEAWEEELPQPTDEYVDEPAGEIICFFHTGTAPVRLNVGYDDTIADVRTALRERGNYVDGMAVILRGQTVPSEEERGTYVQPGDQLTFTGNVKGA